jgi:hypothetical protein
LPAPNNALIAQLVEHLICNQRVRGSSPCGGTIIKSYVYRQLSDLDTGTLRAMLNDDGRTMLDNIRTNIEGREVQYAGMVKW